MRHTKLAERPDLVDWDGKLVPRALVEGVPARGACPNCGGLGEIPEEIDEDRWSTMVPCWRCRRYCKACKAWVLKEGHEHA